MTTPSGVFARCPACGDETPLDPALIDLRGSWWTFTCTLCHRLVSKPADRRVRGLLLQAGVVDRGGTHPEPHDATAPPLATDDVLAFVSDLRREDIVARVKAER